METSRRITKRKIAETQLIRAVLLLVEENDPISALTLAGAAEEILGKMAARGKQRTAFDESIEFARQYWDIASANIKANGGTMKPFNDKKARQILNRLRNELKHNDGGKNVKVEAMFQYEAEEMILRALRNFEKLYNRLPNHKKVVDWWDFMSL